MNIVGELWVESEDMHMYVAPSAKKGEAGTMGTAQWVLAIQANSSSALPAFNLPLGQDCLLPCPPAPLTWKFACHPLLAILPFDQD